MANRKNERESEQLEAQRETGRKQEDGRELGNKYGGRLSNGIENGHVGKGTGTGRGGCLRVKKHVLKRGESQRILQLDRLIDEQLLLLLVPKLSCRQLLA